MADAVVCGPTCCCLCLQTQGRDARAPTAEEIQEIVFKIWQALKQDPEWAARLVNGELPIWSLDNAPVHSKALEGWEDPHGWRMKLGIRGVLRCPPPYSPDLHQVIEHAHAITCDELYHRLAPKLQPGAEAVNVPQFWELLQASFYEKCTPDVIAGNVDWLPHVWEAVEEAKGGWPPAKFR